MAAYSLVYDSRHLQPRTGISSGTPCLVIQYGLPFYRAARRYAPRRRSRRIYVRARTDQHSAQLWWPGLGAQVGQTDTQTDGRIAASLNAALRRGHNNLRRYYSDRSNDDELWHRQLTAGSMLLPLSIDGTDGRTDRRTSDRYIDAYRFGHQTVRELSTPFAQVSITTCN